jgi:sugar lactone lactonase YvrE
MRWEYQWDSEDPIALISERFRPGTNPKHGAIVFPPAVGQDGNVYLLRPHDYTEPKGLSLVAAWEGKKWELRPKGGICNLPAIADDGSLVFGASEGLSWAVAPYGEKKWTYKFSPASYFTSRDFGGGASSPARSPACSQPAVAADGTSYWLGHGVYALTKDGVLRWAFEPGEDFHFVSLAADGTIYALDEGGLFAVTPGGKQRWKFALERSKYFAGELAVEKDETIYLTAFINSDSGLYAITPQGTLKWLFRGERLAHTLAAPDGTIYVTRTTDNRTSVVALDPNGKVKWTSPEGSDSLGIASDGTLFVCEVRDLVATGPCGKPIWMARLPEDPDEVDAYVPTKAITLAPDGRFYIGDFLGRLATLDVPAGLAADGWPARFHDPRNTARAGAR